jgi:hypothetical protein
VGLLERNSPAVWKMDKYAFISKKVGVEKPSLNLNQFQLFKPFFKIKMGSTLSSLGESMA